MKLGDSMRRVNAWLLVPAVLLALGVGVLIGRAGDDDSNDTASGRTDVLGQQFERDETTTTTEVEETTTTAAETTTTTAAVTTTTTAKATTATTAATVTATTAAPAPATTTTRAPAGDPNCGTGPASAGANLTVSGSGPPSSPTFTYSGPVSVTNNTGKAIELTALVLRLVSSDGTSQDVAVAGAAGTVIQTGVTHQFNFTHQTSHPPKQDGASVSAFAYKPPGGTKNCASI